MQAMAHVDNRTVGSLTKHLQSMVLSLCTHSGQLSKTHGKPGALLQKAVKIVSRTVADQMPPSETAPSNGADCTKQLPQQDADDDNVLRVNSWLLQEMGFAEDDALAALIGAEGVVEDAIDLARGFEVASPEGQSIQE
eukprot:TRINITY_DN8498_c0_g1_i1.p2 TRINITY_DN8498_c0_g1~~TRINITY_DN8498_c0_g1_i1.p2  ORF type:complete len:138 (+),score=39.73 TRINITY_DN8498_c0_g1_i1:782-1195(+)